MVESLGLYISVPFCRSKCSFCNFASNVYAGADHSRYVDRLVEELRRSRKRASAIGVVLPEHVDTVYLGGGTPSVLSPELLQRLFTAVREEFRVVRDAEITMECAPGQIDDKVLAAMVSCGVNRVSLGVQSFVDREAATTGRLHNRAVVLQDIGRLRSAAIERINVDLIAGLPHQTLASWDESLGVLIHMGVEHASVYMLEVDDESRLGKEMLQGGARYHAGAVPKDDTIAAMFEMAEERLGAAGIEPYEISNFAVKGRQSRHNLKYWRREPYLGVGLDAHSMLRRDDGRAVRFGYGDHLQGFMDGAGWENVEALTARAELEEAWFLGLRLLAGVKLDALRSEFGSAIDAFLPLISSLENDGLLVREGDRVALTRRARLISNEVFSQILEAGDEQLCPAS